MAATLLSCQRSSSPPLRRPLFKRGQLWGRPHPRLELFTPTVYAGIEFVQELGGPKSECYYHFRRIKINGEETEYVLKMARTTVPMASLLKAERPSAMGEFRFYAPPTSASTSSPMPWLPTRTLLLPLTCKECERTQANCTSWEFGQTTPRSLKAESWEISAAHSRRRIRRSHIYPERLRKMRVAAPLLLGLGRRTRRRRPRALSRGL